MKQRDMIRFGVGYYLVPQVACVFVLGPHALGSAPRTVGTFGPTLQVGMLLDYDDAGYSIPELDHEGMLRSISSLVASSS